MPIRGQSQGRKIAPVPDRLKYDEKEVVHSVIIDRCKKCGGVWLDGGELETMKKAIKSGEGDDFVKGFLFGMVIG